MILNTYVNLKLVSVHAIEKREFNFVAFAIAPAKRQVVKLAVARSSIFLDCSLSLGQLDKFLMTLRY